MVKKQAAALLMRNLYYHPTWHFMRFALFEASPLLLKATGL
jgi:hypothetical protein